MTKSYLDEIEDEADRARWQERMEQKRHCPPDDTATVSDHADILARHIIREALLLATLILKQAAVQATSINTKTTADVTDISRVTIQWHPGPAQGGSLPDEPDTYLTLCNNTLTGFVVPCGYRVELMTGIDKDGDLLIDGDWDHVVWWCYSHEIWPRRTK